MKSSRQALRSTRPSVPPGLLPGLIACQWEGRHPCAGRPSSSLLPSSDSLLSHVEQLLRAFILKISVCDAVLDHNPPGVLFPTPSSLGISMAQCWPVSLGPYLAAPSRLSSFLPYRTPLKNPPTLGGLPD